LRISALTGRKSARKSEREGGENMHEQEPPPNGSPKAKLNRSIMDILSIASARESSVCELLDEKAFIRTLCLERKRTERSSNRFVLMLLESNGLLKSGPDQQALQKVIRALSDATRETDVKGWYEEESILGVIFTEIGAADGRAVANALLTRITDALSSSLSIEQIHKIRLSFHVFPEEAGNGSDRAVDLPLYPDLVPNADGRRVSRILKRTIDILGSLFALIVFSPLFLLICAAIKLTSRGPVLFRQKRVGQYGRRFVFLKFRSMYFGNDSRVHEQYVAQLIKGADCGEAGSGGQKVYKLTNDPRVTPVGRLLRRTSLDELPQFLNVLTGHMSLVGPRPPVLYEFEQYAAWHKRRLLAVKPGITGLWQVRGRSRVKFDDMVRLDLKYASSWSLWLDIKILWLTPAAVFSREGAY
jgi:lipopolysaccharide/colanic/teichoic acid biosynthesis glycosyltransferase